MNKNNLLIFLIGIFLTIFFTFPFVFYLDKFYEPNQDFMFFDWLFQWNYHAFSSGLIFNVHGYFNSNQFLLIKNSLALADVVLLPSLLIYTPVYFITHNTVFSLNFLIFISFFLNFISSYFCLNYFIKNKIGSLFGAIVYTFSPVAFMRFPSHIEYLQRYLIPPIFVYLVIFLNKPDFKKGLIFYLIYFLSWLTNIQLTIFSSFFIIIFFLHYLVLKIRKSAFVIWIKKIIKYLLIAIPIFLLLFYLYSPYWELSSNKDYKRTIEDAEHYSADVIDYFVGNPNQKVFGDFYQNLDVYQKKEVDGTVNYAEHTLLIGGIAYLLFILFFLSKNNFKGNSYKLISIICIFFGVILSFGPSTIVGIYKINLPYYYVYNFVQLLGAIRTPTRVILVTIFFISLIIGLAIKKINNSNCCIRNLVIIILFLLLLIEYKQRISITTFENHFVEYNLSQKNVIFFPFNDNTDQTAIYLINSIKKGFTMVNGSIGTYIQENLDLKKELSENEFNNKWFNTLQSRDIDYAIFDLRELNKNKYLLILEKLDKCIIYKDTNWIIVDIKKYGKN